ncbi:hypothetical protein D5086_015160 [Populus alba]|uniref:Uncharacterized protein n=1 Tax=Populus alba TaxID=43335 RepID=A0ACC4BZL2_POPAL
MGVSGTLEFLSDLVGSGGHKHKRKQLQTVELKVRMDCDGCELKVKNALSSMSGVKKVEINRKQQRVTVSGYVDSNKVLKKAKSTGKRAEIWPYVPYSLVAQPFATQAYDKRAPPGYVRKVENTAAIGTVTRYEDPYTSIFSDDNPNACSIISSLFISLTTPSGKFIGKKGYHYNRSRAEIHLSYLLPSDLNGFAASSD